MASIWRKIQREAPVGTLVIEFAAADYHSGIVPSGGMQVRVFKSKNSAVLHDCVYVPALSVTIRMQHMFVCLFVCLFVNNTTMHMQMEACNTMDVSWSPFAGTHVSVFRKSELASSSGQYYDYAE